MMNLAPKMVAKVGPFKNFWWKDSRTSQKKSVIGVRLFFDNLREEIIPTKEGLVKLLLLKLCVLYHYIETFQEGVFNLLCLLAKI